MKRLVGVVVVGLLMTSGIQAKVDPLSKIEIKSNRAFSTPLKQEPGFFLVKYEQDVHVELADKTHITAESLEVIVARNLFAKNKKEKTLVSKTATTNQTSPKVAATTQQVKSVVLKGNVKINRLNHVVRADRAELLVEKKQCAAQGNVHIAQKRVAQNDIPVVIDSEKAVLDLTSEKLLLVGTEKAPVSTTFELTSLPSKKNKNT